MKVYHVSSEKGSYWKESPVTMDASNIDVTILKKSKMQVIKGFGGCFNELGWEAIKLADEKQKTEFLDDLFSKKECNFNYGRVPIGANDFSMEWYSCDETADDYQLKHFNIDRDKVYTIPFVKEAMARQPEFMVFASPWSPPIWMKTKKAYNYGTLRMEPKVLKAYADYFVKFVQAYAAEGVKVGQIHVQNEPMADQKYPSCLWKGEQIREFVRNYLGPAVEKSGLDLQIWLGTINGPFVDFMMKEVSAPFCEFYDQFANVILSDEKTRSYITGIGVQWGGKHVLEQITASYPELHVMQTESECGDGKNSWEHMEYIFNQMWFYFRHGAERYTYWNLALKEGGVSNWGWSQNSLCTVNEETGELVRQPEFYLMKHFSHFVKKGAVYLETSGHWTTNTVAFENPDGSIVLVVESNMNQEREFSFNNKNCKFTAKIHPHSLHTFVIEGDSYNG